jgi:hypothetical protein
MEDFIIWIFKYGILGNLLFFFLIGPIIEHVMELTGMSKKLSKDVDGKPLSFKKSIKKFKFSDETKQ